MVSVIVPILIQTLKHPSSTICVILIDFLTHITLLQRGVNVLPLAATSMARWAAVPVAAAVCRT